MADLFDRLKTSRPTQPRVQEQTRRANQGPAITEAQGTATTALTEHLIGEITGYGGASDPPGGKWAICDGRTLSIQTYPDLYAVLSATWNTGGEPAGEFRIPDLRSRVTVGAGQGAGLTSRALASGFGSETHVLSQNEMPGHNHGGVTGGDSHNHGGSTVADTHLHGGDTYSLETRVSLDVYAGTYSVVQNVTNADGNTGSDTHSHNIPTDTHSHAISNAGGGQSHNNMPPSVAVQKIIRIQR